MEGKERRVGAVRAVWGRCGAGGCAGAALQHYFVFGGEEGMWAVSNGGGVGVGGGCIGGGEGRAVGAVSAVWGR